MKKLLNTQPINIDLALLIFRVVIGLFMMSMHGYPKLLKFSDEEIKFYSFLGMGAGISLGLAVFAEFLCSLFIGLGLFTRIAALFNFVTMFVAGFMVHGDDPFKKKEMALLYLASFTLLLFTGPGKYSVDQLITARKK